MALGNKNKIEGKAYSLKLKMKEGETFLDVPYFDLQKKVGDEYKSMKGDDLAAITGSDELIHDVAGQLVKVDTRIGEFEGSPVHSYTLALRDSNRNEVYYVNVGLGSSLGRSLANSLLNLTAFNDVEIGLYGQKNKETKKVYPAACLRQGDDRKVVKWKYDPKDPASGLPAAREFEGRGGKKERDYTAQEEFFIAQLKELGKKVEASSKGTKQPEKAPTAPVPSNGDTLDEDVPF